MLPGSTIRKVLSLPDGYCSSTILLIEKAGELMVFKTTKQDEGDVISTLREHMSEGIPEVVESAPEYIITKFVPGRTLESYWETKVPASLGKDWFTQILNIVEDIHKAGVHYRKLDDASNIIITETGNVVIVDFGEATKIKKLGPLQDILDLVVLLQQFGPVLSKYPEDIHADKYLEALAAEQPEYKDIADRLTRLYHSYRIV